jgi:hypothetical protein
MLDWMKRRALTVYRDREVRAEAPKASLRAMSGTYLLLYTYLENRYADTVVLTFAEIEDLLGFTLPDAAHSREEWWTAAAASGAGLNYADSWVLASRTAIPNMTAHTVSFARAS